jgi:hypothetical protein
MLARSHSRYLLTVAIVLLLAPTIWLAWYCIPDFHTTREIMGRGKMIIGPALAPPAVPFSILVAGLYLPGVLLLCSAFVAARRR